MNFFEQELRKLFEDGEIIHEPRFVGRACLGELDGDLRVRAEFTNLGIACEYRALKVTVLKRTDGEVDKLLLDLADVMGKKTVPDSNFPGGIAPHFCTYGDGEWYVYQPTAADYQALRRAVDDYLDVFRERTQEWEHPAPARKSPGRSASKKARDAR